MTHRRPTLPTLSGLILATLGISAPIWAQSYETGGIQLSFGLRLGIDAASNRTLATTNEKGSAEANAGLSFGLLTETGTQRLAFNATGSLRNVNGGNATGLNEGFSNPSLALDYSRNSAAADLRLSASLSETDLADNALIFDEETGAFVLLNGTATRRNTSASARYNWGIDAPLGFGVSAQVVKNSYRNGVVTDVDGTPLNDSTRSSLGVSARLAFDEATNLSAALNFSRFDEQGAATTRDTVAFDTTLTIDRPLGAISLTFGATDTEDGTRYSLSTGRSFAYPLGTLSGRVGVVRGVTGEIVLSGALSASRDLPRGGLNVSFARDVSSGNQQDTEVTNTSLRMGYRHDLSELATLNFGFDVGNSQIDTSGQSTTSATLNATYNRALTKDWDMNFGVRHRYRDADVSGTARSNELFMNLNRSFVTRF